MRSYSYLNTSKTILQQYDGNIPFAAWIKQFFKAHKKYGSKDRREIAHLCFSYFRLGHAFKELPVEERILLGVFLSSVESNFVLSELKPVWNANVQLPPVEKISFLNLQNEIKTLFPLINELSGEIEANAFITSFLLQPLLYLRLRPGKKNRVEDKLRKAGIDFEIMNNDCLALANSSKIDEVIELNAEAVVQDLNSQKVLEPLPGELKERKKIEAWDCCAASGGKSILAYDTIPHLALTVSDLRESILRNLKKRFEQAGIKKYKSFVADLSTPNAKLQTANFDLVICDAPCSGSGTWGRTPEQLQFFNPKKLEHYARLQKAIALNAAKAVNAGGYFLYITCSVFKKENEEVVEFIQQRTSLQLLSSHYYKGYDKKADSLFTALFRL